MPKERPKEFHERITQLARQEVVDYAKEAAALGITQKNLRPRVWRRRKQLKIALKRQPTQNANRPSEEAIQRAQLDADRAIEALNQLVIDVSNGASKDAVPGLDLKRKASETVLKMLGFGAAQTNIQFNVALIAQDKTKLKELLALWENDDDAQRALWAWIEPRAAKRGWR